MVDPRRIEELVDRLIRNLTLLDELASIPTEELRGDPLRLGGAKYYLVVAVEVCIDIANHVIASEGLRRPADFADAFAILGEEGLLSEGLTTTTRDMARFRNLLVHEYAEVDDVRVLEILREGREDLRRFASVAAGFAAEESPADEGPDR